jgi:hypothetical protein
MAVTVSAAGQLGVDSYTRTITATADADTTAVIPHGLVFNSTPDAAANLDYRLKQASAPGTLANWFVASIDITNITLTKGTAVGSGAALPQLVVEYFRRSSLIGR